MAAEFGKAVCILTKRQLLWPIFSIASTSSEACPKNFLINDLSGGSSYTRQWNIIPNTGYTFINQPTVPAELLN
jgi:hypothetical protein